MEKKIILQNKKVFYEYYIEDKLECGIQLYGNEIKSIRQHNFNIKNAWCSIQDNELVIRGMHISKWHTANDFDVNEDRERKLLVHRKEIIKLQQVVQQQGYTLMPIEVYMLDNKCKILLGICKGKHIYDKRRCEKEKQIKKDIARFS